MLDHEQNLFVDRPHQVPRGRRSVPHHVLEVDNVVPGDCCGRADGDTGQHDPQVTLHELLYGEVICPVTSLGEPNLLEGPLGGERGYQWAFDLTHLW